MILPILHRVINARTEDESLKDTLAVSFTFLVTVGLCGWVPNDTSWMECATLPADHVFTPELDIIIYQTPAFDKLEEALAYIRLWHSNMALQRLPILGDIEDPLYRDKVRVLSALTTEQICSGISTRKNA